MKKFNLIVDVAFTFFLIVYTIYDIFMGTSNHDAYYIACAILDFIILHMSVKNIKEYIDIED